MYSCLNEKTARFLATEHGLLFGWSIFPPRGTWYVGTAEQLKAAGVLDPQEPEVPPTSPGIERMIDGLRVSATPVLRRGVGSHGDMVMSGPEKHKGLGVPRRTRNVYAIRLGIRPDGCAAGGFCWYATRAEAEKAWDGFLVRNESTG